MNFFGKIPVSSILDITVTLQTFGAMVLITFTHLLGTWTIFSPSLLFSSGAIALSNRLPFAVFFFLTCGYGDACDQFCGRSVPVKVGFLNFFAALADLA